jgi:hypothetical protein
MNLDGEGAGNSPLRTRSTPFPACSGSCSPEPNQKSAYTKGSAVKELTDLAEDFLESGVESRLVQLVLVERQAKRPDQQRILLTGVYSPLDQLLHRTLGFERKQG